MSGDFRMNTASFTYHRDPKIDSVIARHMKVIVDKLLEHFPVINSIMLAGGFGRGEGSVILLSNGDVKPLGDYDIYVVTDSKIDPLKFNEMIEEIARAIDVPTAFLSVEFIPRRAIQRLSYDISSYELKVASKILHGRDFRSLIPVDKDEVALSSGFITLSIRAIMMLRLLQKVHSGISSPQDRQECLYYCTKAFTEICTALSLLEGFYEPSYAMRADIFAARFKIMGELKKKVPDLAQKVKEYTSIKLWSAFDKKSLDKALIEASHYLKISFIYFTSRYLGIRLRRGKWQQNAKLMYNRLRLVFLNSFLVPALKRRRMYFKLLVNPLILGIQLLENVLFVVRTYQTKKIIYLKPLLFCCSPAIKTFIASTLAFYSVDVSRMRIDPDLLQEAHKYVTRVYPCRISPSNTNWSCWKTLKKVYDACVRSMELYSSTKRYF